MSLIREAWITGVRNCELCGADLNCVSAQRIGVSAAFFIAQEFQLTGSYIYDVYAVRLVANQRSVNTRATGSR